MPPQVHLRNGHIGPGMDYIHYDGCSGVVVEYRTRNREVAGSTHTRFTASNIEQVANLCVLRPTQPPTLSGTGND